MSSTSVVHDEVPIDVLDLPIREVPCDNVKVDEFQMDVKECGYRDSETYFTVGILESVPRWVNNAHIGRRAEIVRRISDHSYVEHTLES